MPSRAGAAPRRNAATAPPPRATSALVRLVRSLVAADVLGDPLLERLEPLEELLRRNRLLRLAAEQPRGRIDGGLPRHLLDGLGGALLVRLCERLNAVEV